MQARMPVTNFPVSYTQLKGIVDLNDVMGNSVDKIKMLRQLLGINDGSKEILLQEFQLKILISVLLQASPSQDAKAIELKAEIFSDPSKQQIFDNLSKPPSPLPLTRLGIYASPSVPTSPNADQPKSGSFKLRRGSNGDAS